MNIHIAVFSYKRKSQRTYLSQTDGTYLLRRKSVSHDQRQIPRPLSLLGKLNHQINICSSDSERSPLHPSIIHMISHIQRQCSEPVRDLADSGPTKSHRNKKSQWQVLGCRAQRGQCARERGSPIDGHKESIGSAESLRESSRGSVGRVALSRIILSPPLALTSVGQWQRGEDGDISIASKSLALYTDCTGRWAELQVSSGLSVEAQKYQRAAL